MGDNFAYKILTKNKMENSKIIHLSEPNTLSRFLSEKEQPAIVSLKITGLIGREDFDDVLDNMCHTYGNYDDDDNFIPDYEESFALRHLDMGEATYVDGENLPYFGGHAHLITLVLPKGISNTTDGFESNTGIHDCELLETLILPDGLVTVGGFESCPRLTNIVLPESVETISSLAFSGCKSISEIQIPMNVKYIDGSCFSGCNISKYVVDENNPYYTTRDGVIYSKDLRTLVAFPSAHPSKHFSIPKTTKIIGQSAFEDSAIETVDLPYGLEAISDFAFQCSSVRSMVIPDSVTDIGELTFSSCQNLERLVLSASLTEIGEQVFSQCPKLEAIDIPASVKVIAYTNLAWSDLREVTFHDGLEEIRENYILSTTPGRLTDIYLPQTLKKVPGGLFNYCPLKEFRVDSANPYFCVIDNALCSKDGKILYSVPAIFHDRYIVPEGVEVIARLAFVFYRGIKSITLPSSIRIIEERAFQGITDLHQITIPAGVEQVHIDALWADDLETVIMKSSYPPEMTGKINDTEWRYKNVRLLVPSQSVETYRNAQGWKYFRVEAYS